MGVAVRVGPIGEGELSEASAPPYFLTEDVKHTLSVGTGSPSQPALH